MQENLNPGQVFVGMSPKGWLMPGTHPGEIAVAPFQENTATLKIKGILNPEAVQSAHFSLKDAAQKIASIETNEFMSEIENGKSTPRERGHVENILGTAASNMAGEFVRYVDPEKGLIWEANGATSEIDRVRALNQHIGYVTNEITTALNLDIGQKKRVKKALSAVFKQDYTDTEISGKNDRLSAVISNLNPDGNLNGKSNISELNEYLDANSWMLDKQDELALSVNHAGILALNATLEYAHSVLDMSQGQVQAVFDRPDNELLHLLKTEMREISAEDRNTAKVVKFASWSAHMLWEIGGAVGKGLVQKKPSRYAQADYRISSYPGMIEKGLEENPKDPDKVWRECAKDIVQIQSAFQLSEALSLLQTRKAEQV